MLTNSATSCCIPQATENMETEATALRRRVSHAERRFGELRRLDLGKLLELKREWGVSMQALPWAYRMGLVSAEARTKLGDERARLENQKAGIESVVRSRAYPARIDASEAQFTDHEAAAIAGYANPRTIIPPEGGRLHAI